MAIVPLTTEKKRVITTHTTENQYYSICYNKNKRWNYIYMTMNKMKWNQKIKNEKINRKVESVRKKGDNM